MIAKLSSNPQYKFIKKVIVPYQTISIDTANNLEMIISPYLLNKIKTFDIAELKAFRMYIRFTGASLTGSFTLFHPTKFVLGNTDSVPIRNECYVNLNNGLSVNAIDPPIGMFGDSTTFVTGLLNPTFFEILDTSSLDNFHILVKDTTNSIGSFLRSVEIIQLEFDIYSPMLVTSI